LTDLNPKDTCQTLNRRAISYVPPVKRFSVPLFYTEFLGGSVVAEMAQAGFARAVRPKKVKAHDRYREDRTQAGADPVDPPTLPE
jgi:hypothetical protein